MRVLLALTALLGLGCDPPREEVARPATREAEVDPAQLAPLAIGDRWRERVGDGVHRTRGVTAHTLEELAVVFGQGDRRPSFYSATARRVALVDPSGRVLEPLLSAPLREGATWSYTLGEGASAASCEVEVQDSGVSREVGGATLDGCLQISRRCLHPAGLVFTSETTRLSEETWCPRVGRVLARQTLDPPLAGAPAVTTVELLAYRVAGAPVAPRPARFDCDQVLLLPSDVHAACGPDWTFVEERSIEDGCVHTFAREDASLEVRASRRSSAASAERALDEILEASGAERVLGEVRVAERDGGVTAGGTEGPHLVIVQASACEAERAARLVPFTRSLMPGR